MRNGVGMGVLAAVAVSAGTAAADVTIDFDTDGFGNALVSGQGFTGEEYLALGVRITIDSPNGSPMNLFDTRVTTGGDGDLRTGANWDTPELGNVLIAQDKGVAISNPDDDEAGARFIFDFTPGNPFGVAGLSISMLDMEEPGSPIFGGVTLDGRALSLAPSSVTLVNPNFTADNSLRVYTFDIPTELREVSVEIPNASGALASLSYVSAPAPGAVFTVAMSALALSRRRRG